MRHVEEAVVLSDHHEPHEAVEVEEQTQYCTPAAGSGPLAELGAPTLSHQNSHYCRRSSAQPQPKRSGVVVVPTLVSDRQPAAAPLGCTTAGRAGLRLTNRKSGAYQT